MKKSMAKQGIFYHTVLIGIVLAVIILSGWFVFQPEQGRAAGIISIDWVRQHQDPTLPNWDAVTMSADGRCLAGCSTSGLIGTSITGGATWHPQLYPSVQWRGIAASADGRRLAVCSTHNGAIYTFQNNDMQLKECKTAGRRNWQSIASSADGSCLVACVGYGNGDIYVSNDGGANWMDCEAAGNRYWQCVAISADGKRIAACAKTYSAKPYKIGLDEIYTSPDGGLTWNDCKAAGTREWDDIAISADGNHLIACYSDLSKETYLMTSADGGTTWTVQENAGLRRWKKVAVSPDGSHLAAFYVERYFYLGSGSIAEPVNRLIISEDNGATWFDQTPNQSEGEWNSIRMSADGRYLALVGRYGTFTGTQKTIKRIVPIQTLTGHADGVNALAITPDGKQLISGSLDRTIKFWDLATGHVNSTLSDPEDAIYALAITRDGKRLIAGVSSFKIKIWDLETGRIVATLTGHDHIVNALAITPDGKQLISGSWDRMIKIWDLETGKCIKTLTGHTNAVKALAITPDGEWLISGSADQTIKFWTLVNGQSFRNWATEAGSYVNALAVTPDGKRLIVGASDQTITLRNLFGGEVISTFTSNTDVNALAITPDGKRLIVGSKDKTITIWELEDKKS